LLYVVVLLLTFWCESEWSIVALVEKNSKCRTVTFTLLYSCMISYVPLLLKNTACTLVFTTLTLSSHVAGQQLAVPTKGTVSPHHPPQTSWNPKKAIGMREYWCNLLLWVTFFFF